MKLTDEEGKRLLTHLRGKVKDLTPCRICGHKGNASIDPTVLQIGAFSKGTLLVGGPTMPLIAVCCTNCGYTSLFNALIAGVVQPESATAEPANATESEVADEK